MLSATAAVGVIASPSSAEQTQDRAPLIGASRSTAISGQYIVVLEPGRARSAAVDPRHRTVTAGGDVTHTFGPTLDGFSARLSQDALETMRTHPDVAYIEADQRVAIRATQVGATWGIDRIDQTRRSLDGRYRYDRTGAGVTAYIIDTGVRATHSQFGGRVAKGFTAIEDGRGTGDCNGHGTHVAGTVGGKTLGTAKQVTLRPVRVFNCRGSGSTSGIIAGLEWVTNHHTGTTPAVANMSMGGGLSPALDTAVTNAIGDGVTVVVSAGNDSTDACWASPARVEAALTVGSTTSSDRRSDFSNTGPCLDLFAPGSGITSAWADGDNAKRSLSGTSMAAPHTAGAAALYLQRYPGATPAMVSSALVTGATMGAVTGRGPGSPDRLLFSRASAAPVG